MRLSSLLLVAVAGGLVLAGAVPANAQWAGKEETREGLIHVFNPATPAANAQTVSPELLWRIGGEDDEEVIFGVLSDIDTDASGNVYLLDSQLSEVLVYAPDGTYLRSIGREGEGPGEFRRAGDMFLTGDGQVAVVQRMPGKVVLLSLEGDPMGEWALPKGTDGAPVFLRDAGPAGESIVVGMGEFKRGEGKMEMTNQLARVDKNGKVVATFHTSSFTRDFANMNFDEKRDAQPLWACSSDGRVFMNMGYDGYIIEAFNPAGQKERVITREYTSRKRSAQEMEDNKPQIRIRGGNRTEAPDVKASETDRDVQTLFCRDDGTLWVLSSHGAFDTPKGVIATFDVFNDKGHYLQEVSIKGEGSFRDDGLHFVGDRLYVVRELRSAQRAQHGDETNADAADEEAVPMSVICYNLAGIVKAAR